MANGKREKQNVSTSIQLLNKKIKLPFEGEKGDGFFSLKTLACSLFLLLFLIPTITFAQNIPDQPTGHVNDFANMLTRSEQQQLEQKLRGYRDTTTTVIAIATINSLEGHDIQQVGTELFNRWNIWEGDKNNGVLILISKQDRRMRIDVGYGLEGAIPDVMAGRIIREVLTPAFKKGNYYAGIDRATTIIIDLASGEFEGQLTERRSSNKDDTASLIVFLLFLAFVIYASSRSGGGKNGGKRRRTMGPGGFIFLGGGFGGGGSGFGGGGGGFGGFSGGGGFGAGGGGASGGW